MLNMIVDLAVARAEKPEHGAWPANRSLPAAGVNCDVGRFFNLECAGRRALDDLCLQYQFLDGVRVQRLAVPNEDLGLPAAHLAPRAVSRGRRARSLACLLLVTL